MEKEDDNIEKNDVTLKKVKKRKENYWIKVVKIKKKMSGKRWKEKWGRIRNKGGGITILKKITEKNPQYSLLWVFFLNEDE